ncbi:MAG: D-alanyl-D-alanine carboxypeptidase/D-alanyl-D-alanine-endopeptidase [Gemmatimonadetes bacterium]|nr:D-alanyl-D-alanine carboxypeptidase/D-alanyl-D-alanine-endopeptidase [Gemmatimonadota bacterium]
MTAPNRTLRTVTTIIASVLLSAIVAPLPTIQAQSLSRRVDRRLDTPPLQRNLWGVVLTTEGGEVLFGRNAERLFMPASNTKLVVGAVASALLPGDFTVTTSVYSTGPVVDGVVQGDLVLYGRGDPTFSRRCYGVDTTLVGACENDPLKPLKLMALQLKVRGIRAVAGDIIGDGSYFEPTVVHPSWEAYDLNWWYAAPVSGLGFNDNAIDITYAPGPDIDTPPTISFSPDFGDVSFTNRARTSARGSSKTIDFYRAQGTMDVWAEGDLPLGRNERTEYFALPDPNLFTAQAFRSALIAEGIAVAGATLSTTDSLQYRHTRSSAALAEVQSRPLKDWIFPILNSSQNWFAEMTLKQLGKQFGSAGSWHEGLEVEKRFLIDSVGIDSTQFSFSDGSGLAGNNVVTPLALAQLLGYMRHHPNFDVFAAGLPQSGSRGSLRSRFLGTPLEGRVMAKTGSISKVNSLSGYLERRNGQQLIFSVIANHHILGYTAMTQYIDSVVVDLAR